MHDLATQTIVELSWIPYRSVISRRDYQTLLQMLVDELVKLKEHKILLGKVVEEIISSVQVTQDKWRADYKQES